MNKYGYEINTETTKWDNRYIHKYVHLIIITHSSQYGTDQLKNDGLFYFSTFQYIFHIIFTLKGFFYFIIPHLFMLQKESVAP